MGMKRRDFLGTTVAASALAAVSAGGASAQGTQPLKACVIGDSKEGGYGHYMHLAWAHRKDVQVVGLADPDEQGRAKHAAEAKAQRTYADYREMLDKEKPALVSVGPRCTHRHKEYVLACAAHGAHGFLEKPVATDLAEDDAMIQAIEAKNLKWAIAHNFRVSPVIRHLKQMLFKEKIIGYVIDVRGRGKEDHRAGGEDLVVLGCHVFDLMIELMGKPSWCTADITMNGKPAAKEHVRQASEPLGPILGNRLNAMFGFRKGVAGHFSSMVSRDGNGGRWGLDIYGTKGIITVRMDVVPQVFLLRDPSWAPGGSGAKWEPLPGAPAVTMAEPKNGRNAPIVDDLLAAITENREPEVSLQRGREAHQMVQAVFESHVRGGRVAMPLEHRAHPLKSWA